MSTNILYGNSAVTQNEILNTFFVGIRARWARSPWARQVGAGHSSLFKFCLPSIHIAVVQSTIPTNWDKFTININTFFNFCTKKFIVARCSRENSIIISMKIVTYRNYLWVCMHWPLETDWWFCPSPKSTASSPTSMVAAATLVVTIKIYELFLDCTSYI